MCAQHLSGVAEMLRWPSSIQGVLLSHPNCLHAGNVRQSGVCQWTGLHVLKGHFGRECVTGSDIGAGWVAGSPLQFGSVGKHSPVLFSNRARWNFHHDALWQALIMHDGRHIWRAGLHRVPSACGALAEARGVWVGSCVLWAEHSVHWAMYGVHMCYAVHTWQWVLSGCHVMAAL